MFPLYGQKPEDRRGSYQQEIRVRDDREGSTDFSADVKKAGYP
jgi:hypothetical protein